MKPRTAFWLSALLMLSSGPAAAQSLAPTRITVAGSHFARMFDESLVRDYVNEHPGALVSTELIGPEGSQPPLPDVVLLVRTSEEAVAPWKAARYQEVFSARAVGHNSLRAVVDPSCPVTGITADQLQGILSGKITSWDRVGGPARPIRRTRGYPWGAVLSAAGDPDALAIVQTTEWLADTGLRLLKITSKPGEDKDGLSADQLSILCRDGASPEAKDFAGFVRRKFCEGYHVRSGAWVAVLCPAEEEMWPAPGSLAAPRNIAGAVAVLPVEPRAMYFLPLKPNHVAAMEVRIGEAIAADRSLTVVDRHELNRVLAERRLAILCRKTTDPALKPILAADMLVDSSIVTENHQTCLVIQALDSVTGSRLGYLRAAINPAAPEQFSPPIETRIAQWWPGVLANLERARTLSIVTVCGVYPGTRTWEEADRLGRAVADAIRRDLRCFLAERQPSVNAHTETLMRFMGLSRVCGGNVTAAADYLAEVRMSSDRRAEARVVRATDRKVLAKATLDAESSAALGTAVAEWFRKQSDLFATKPPGGRGDGALDDWAKAQARSEFEAARQMSKDLDEEIRGRAVKGPDGISISRTDDNDDRRRLDIVRRAMLAQQLDPTDEEIAGWTISVAYSVADDFPVCRLRAQIGDRYVASFPLSKPREEVYKNMLGAYYRLSDLSEKAPQEFYGPYIPQGLDCKRYQATCLFRTMEIAGLITDCMVRDWRPGMDAVKQLRWIAELFQKTAVDYLRATSASDAAVNEAVDSWAQRYDRVPEIVPSSGYLRLKVMADRKQNRAAAAFFVGLVKAHPDPKDVFWTFLDRGSTQVVLEGVDPLLDQAAQEWKRGKIPTEELIRTAEKRLDEIPEK